jgi:glycosyltransferase involved in cell wall biosynthesis
VSQRTSTVPTVSILVPAFNAARWISETLESALNQTWPAIEIIVVDDGSRDDTLAVARRYQRSGVRVLLQPNLGAATARQLALSGSKGEFIQYLDADDLLSKDKVESQMATLQSAPEGVLAMCPVTYFSAGVVPEAGAVEDGWPFVDSDDPLEWLIGLLGGNGNRGTVPIGCWLTPRSIAQAAGPWAPIRSPDDDGLYFARVVLSSKGLRKTAGRFYYRKQVAGSLTQTRSRELYLGTFETTVLKMNLLLAHSADPRARHAMAKAFMYLAFESYPAYPDISERAVAMVRELGGTSFVPPFGTKPGELIKQLVGWKSARWLQAHYRHGRTVLLNLTRRQKGWRG